MFIKDDNIIDIHRQNKDIVFKKLSNQHNKSFFKLLNIFDVENTVIESKENEIADIKSFHKVPDTVFLLNNNVILDLEFESSPHKSDLARYMVYASLLSDKFTSNCNYNIIFPVKTVVIYPDNVIMPQKDYIKTESLLFSIIQISLGNLIDSDAMLPEMKEMLQKRKSDNNFVPTDEELTKIILAPMGRVSGDREQYCREFASVAGSLLEKTGQKKALSLTVGSLLPYLKRDLIRSLMGLKEKMYKDLLDYCFNGEYSAAIADKKAAEKETAIARAEKEEAVARAEKEAAVARAKIEAVVARAEKEMADVRARADREKMALKMKLKEVDLPTISSYTGLSIEEIDQL
jgi:hypothetical protein